MSKKLVVIDGMSVFYRAYYAVPNLSLKDGTPTGAVYGFAVMALEVVKKLKPDYVCVAWDKTGTNIRSRKALYPAYKAGRKPTPEDFPAQVALLHELLEALNWPLYELDDYEADDIMATFARQAKAKSIETYLVSSDLDLLQTINSHTHVYMPKRGFSEIEILNEAAFTEKHGVRPDQWIDVKALKGDSSDNIPGVRLVGPKQATELILKYDSLEGVYDHLDELKPGLRERLERDREIAFLSKQLVTLFTDAPIKLDLDKAALASGVSPEFVAVLRKLEFRSLLRQAEASLSAPERTTLHAETKKLTLATEVPFTPGKFDKQAPYIAVASPDAVSLWVSAAPGEYSVLPFPEAGSLLEGPLIGHNLKVTFRAALAEGLPCKGEVVHDTRIAAFLLNSLERSRELTDILDEPVDIGEPAEVVAATWEAYNRQKALLSLQPTLAKLAQDVEFPSIFLLAKVEHRGILLDSEYLEAMSKEFEKKIGVIERRIYAQAGQEFNISSPAQLGLILYEKLGLPTTGVKRGKTGYSTGAPELAKLRALHPIADAIIEYREFTKLKSTYIDALPKLVDVNGKLHTTFALDISASGRLSSHDPNLQNIPTRTEIGNAIRSAFVPAEGNVFVSADYNQFELRLAACLANDEELIADFNNGVDVHTKTASEILGVPMEQVTKDMRRQAKVVNFGIMYGMSPHGLSIAANMTFTEAKHFIDRYFELRQPIRAYIDRTLAEAMERGYVETLFGRRRPTPDLKSSNFMVRESAKRAAQNMPIQGTEADLMKMAMLKVEEKLAGLGEQILQIHDSILVETPQKNAEKIAEILKETMEHIHKLPVKLLVDTKSAATWGEL